MAIDTNYSLQIVALTEKVAQLERRLQEQEDVEAVRHLIDHYTALHDLAFQDPKALQQWEALFTEDAHVKYAFGEHFGRKGLGAWAWGPEVAQYDQCHLQSSNFDISFSPDRQVAHVRSNGITHWLYKRDELDRHFDAGAVYRWTIRREPDGKWAIWKIDLYCAWMTGQDPKGVSGRASA
ncbi:SnoaL-like domain-containing protein [Cladophialophora immunda]|nr:SnoaL-like domain-containing protein [Cladophialophora immunda]